VETRPYSLFLILEQYLGAVRYQGKPRRPLRVRTSAGSQETPDTRGGVHRGETIQVRGEYRGNAERTTRIRALGELEQEQYKNKASATSRLTQRQFRRRQKRGAAEARCLPTQPSGNRAENSRNLPRSGFVKFTSHQVKPILLHHSPTCAIGMHTNAHRFRMAVCTQNPLLDMLDKGSGVLGSDTGAIRKPPRLASARLRGESVIGTEMYGALSAPASEAFIAVVTVSLPMNSGAQKGASKKGVISVSPPRDRVAGLLSSVAIKSSGRGSSVRRMKEPGLPDEVP
jgi:hypothetical protein